MALQLDARPPTAPTPGRSRLSRAGRLSRIDTKYSPYLYIAPFFVIFAIFGAWPLAYTFWVSLHDWDLLGSNPTFIGADNYTRLLADGDFWHSVVNTLGIFVLSTVPQLLLALWLANLLNRQLRMRTGWRMAVLVPNVTSTAAVAIVFGVLFGREFGMINWLLDLVGIDGIEWKSNRFASWVAISTMVDWRWTGYNALIFLAAMQAIPATSTRPRRSTARTGPGSSGRSPCRCSSRRSSSASSSPPSAGCNCSPSPGCSTPAPTRSGVGRCASRRR